MYNFATLIINIHFSYLVCCSHGGGHGGESDVANVTVVHGITGIRISQKVQLKKDGSESEISRDQGRERGRESRG